MKNPQSMIMSMLTFGVSGAVFIGAGLITPDPFLSGFFYWCGASCIACVLWVGWMLSMLGKKEMRGDEYEPHYTYHASKNDDFTLVINEAEHWEKPNWIVANNGSLDLGMLTLLSGGELVEGKGDLKIIRTDHVKEFLEENNGTD